MDIKKRGSKKIKSPSQKQYIPFSKAKLKFYTENEYNPPRAQQESLRLRDDWCSKRVIWVNLVIFQIINSFIQNSRAIHTKNIF